MARLLATAGATASFDDGLTEVGKLVLSLCTTPHPFVCVHRIDQGGS